MTQRIIVAHDLASRAASVTQILVRHGYETRLVHDGDAVLRAADAWSPDGAVIDLSLQGRPALEVGSRLREKYGGKIQIVGFTVPSAPALEDEALDAGFDHVVLELGDAAEVLLALSADGATLVRRAQSAAFVFATTLIEHAHGRIRAHKFMQDVDAANRNLTLLRRTLSVLGQSLEHDRLADESRHYVQFQLATLKAHLERLLREED
jgi:DNA-binding response OmpR family regulator